MGSGPQAGRERAGEVQAEDGDADPEPVDPGAVDPEDLDDAIFEELWADGDSLEAEEDFPAGAVEPT